MALEAAPTNRFARLRAVELCSGSFRCKSRFSSPEKREVQRGCNLQTAAAVGALTIAGARYRHHRLYLRRSGCGSRGSGSRSTVKLMALGFGAADHQTSAGPPSQTTTAEMEEDEPELRRWMQSRGCKGLELVRLRTDGRPGLWLRSEEEVTSGRDFLVVPRDCWISVPEPEDGSDQDLEESLAWKLLQERWSGQDSQYAPYVEFLWRQDLRHHPLFWGQEELAWLTACAAAQSAVFSSQEKMERRAQKLEARARAIRSDAAQLESLSTEVRFALALVECRAIGVSGILESDPGMAALVPVLDHLRHDPSERQSLLIGERGDGPMIAQSVEQLKPGSELRCCFESASNIELFSQYGQVPTLGDDSVEQQFAEVERNFFGMVELPVRVSQQTWKATTDQNIRRLKTQLLAKRAGLDLSRTVTGENATLRLPADGSVMGRMLPTARFLVNPVFTEEDCETSFARLFANCNRNLLPENAGKLGTQEVTMLALPPPANAEELGPEIQARQLAIEWCDNSLKRYGKMIERLSEVFADTKGVTASPLQQDTDMEFKTEVGEVTRAHFKAKGKDGITGRSRKAKECRVLSYNGSGMVTVQFLENGVRHSIPENWLVESAQTNDRNSPSGLETRELSVRRARALLAQELILGEISVIESVSDMLKPVLELGLGLMDPQKKDAEKAVLAQKLQAAWLDEYRMFAREAEAEAFNSEINQN